MSASVDQPPVRVCVLVGTDGLGPTAPEEATSRYHGNSDFQRLIAAAGLQWQWLDVARYFEQPDRIRLDAYDVFHNLISEPDQNPGALELAVRLEEICERPVLNSAKQVLQLRRDVVAHLADGIEGLRVPKTLRLTWPDQDQGLLLEEIRDFTWPGILRQTGSHGGETMVLLPDNGALAAAAEPGRTYYLSEFVNYVSNDGRFRKWRFFVIGHAVIFRSLMIGPRWNLHRRDVAESGLTLQEVYGEEKKTLDLFERGKLHGIADMCLALAERLQLDYLGIDCALTSPESAVLFEANATMNFGALHVPPERQHKAQIVTRATEATRQLFTNRFAQCGAATSATESA